MSSHSVIAIFFLSFLMATISRLEFCSEGCIQSEKEVLLNFKLNLTDPSNRLASWDGDGDCCRWSGVICDNLSGHVLGLDLGTQYNQEDYLSGRVLPLGGKISPSLSHLKHLRYLDLSNNNFGGINIPAFLGSLVTLRYLNLSGSGFAGVIPHQLGNLSNLQYLDLRGGYIAMRVVDLNWLSDLSTLTFLDLSSNDLSKCFNWLQVVNSLSRLVELHLSRCQIPNFPSLNSHVNFSFLAMLDLSSNHFTEPLVPSWVFRLENLISLDLSSNNFQGPIPDGLQNMSSGIRELDLSFNNFNSSIPNSLYSLSNLELLKLDYNSLQGEISSLIGNVSSLKTLDLAYNRFEGGIPRSLKHLCNLKLLSLRGVNLKQEINEVLDSLSECISDGLESLFLGYCQLYGHLTDDLGKFKKLTFLVLQGNLISGPIPLYLGEMRSLKYIDLSSNKLNGPLPASLGQLTELVMVLIADNLMEGDVSEIHFANLTNLIGFDASRMGNSVVLKVSPNWIPPLQLSYLKLGSWQVGPQFPDWLRALKSLQTLDLSNSAIVSVLPTWFWDLSSKFKHLDLSHNQLHGVIPNIPSLDSSGPLIDLSFNKFSGQLPYFSSNLSALDLSNNSLSGTISNFLCHEMQEIKNLQLLNLGDNLLSGEIPDCWMTWPYLDVLKLNSNRFHGNIPESIGSLRLLESLHLRRNSLYGDVPLSLGNCTNLISLDLSENKLAGNVPTWIRERHSRLKILSFHENEFYGHIPEELCLVASLHILDLSGNKLSGLIPSCFNSFTEMIKTNDSTGRIYFHDGSSGSVLENGFLVMKGKMVEYDTILGFVRAIDLSRNNLSGKIPTEITSLTGILSLNLSHNSLSGRIPNDIGDMKSLEAMDFSQNQLSGEIPESITSLTFLNLLNLSNNKLTGRIPSGTQLAGFNSSSFMGNELCGHSLTKNCSAEEGDRPGVENKSEEDDGGFEIEWFHFYVSMAPGFVVGFWIVMAPLCFSRKWRFTYFLFLDDLCVRFYLRIYRPIIRFVSRILLKIKYCVT